LQSIIHTNYENVYKILALLDSIKDNIDKKLTYMIKSLYDNNVIKKLFDDLKPLLLSIIEKNKIKIKKERFLVYPFNNIKLGNKSRGRSGRITMRRILRGENNNKLHKFTNKIIRETQLFDVSFLHD
jgi:hypothetical protein